MPDPILTKNGNASTFFFVNHITDSLSMFRKLLAALSRLFSRKQFGGNEAITEVAAEDSNAWRDRQI